MISGFVGKKFFRQFTWEAERGSIKAGGSINESSIKAGATVLILTIFSDFSCDLDATILSDGVI